MAETFKLPCSSYEELIKLFQAYANTKEGTALSLDEMLHIIHSRHDTVLQNPLSLLVAKRKPYI